MSAAQSGVATGDWDVALHAWGGHFLQSTAWQRVQTALGQELLHARGVDWSWAGPLRTGRFPRYMYLPYGPTAARNLDAALAAAAEAARGRSLHFVRVEPFTAEAEAAIREAGALRAVNVQPAATAVLNLRLSEAALRSGLSAGHRGSINAAARKGLQISSSDAPESVEWLLALQRKAAAAGGFVDRSDRYHRAEAEVLMPIGAARMYVASADGAAVAAAMCFDWFDTRYYAHAASDPVAGRKLGAAAPLVWQMIIDARAAGMSTFDFWGVAPDAGPGHPWAGFTRFKLAFGGSVVQRTGTWELPVRPLRHRLYRMVRRRR